MYGVARTARDSYHVQRRGNQCNTFRRSSSIRLLILTIRIFTNAYQLWNETQLLHQYYIRGTRLTRVKTFSRTKWKESNLGRTRGDNIPILTAVSSRASFIAVDAVTCVPVYTFIMVPRLRYMHTLYICQIHVPLGVRAYIYACATSPTRSEISRYRKSVFARAAANPVTNSRLTVDRVKTASIG